MAIVISEKVNFNAKNVTSNKEVHFIWPESLIYQEVIIVLNIHAANNKIHEVKTQNCKEK